MSFEELVLKISPKLKGITYKLNGHFTFFDDDDLYQEALFNLWQNFASGKLSDKTDSYILQGCFFHLKNYIRKTQNKACLISIDTLVDDERKDWDAILSLPDQIDCFERLDDKMLYERIDSFGLTERERDILRLCMKGFTVREIGRQLGISHVRVVKLRNRIKDKCAKFKEEIKQGYQK